MHWRDEGILLLVRPHGETGAIIEVLTSAHGRHAGLVHGAHSARLRPVLQPGSQLLLDWRARLSEHLGHFRVELLTARAGAIMADAGTLAALNSAAALLSALLPERLPEPAVYAETLTLVEALAARTGDWAARYARWELALLAALGFGLDLERCAATGRREDLRWVSPRSGRAVSGAAGAGWADRLLPLPGFLIGRGPATPGAVREALRLSGHFLEHRACRALERPGLPAARARLLHLLEAGRGPGAGGAAA